MVSWRDHPNSTPISDAIFLPIVDSYIYIFLHFVISTSIENLLSGNTAISIRYKKLNKTENVLSKDYIWWEKADNKQIDQYKIISTMS